MKMREACVSFEIFLMVLALVISCKTVSTVVNILNKEIKAIIYKQFHANLKCTQHFQQILG